MSVKTAALPGQQLEQLTSVAVAVPGRRRQRKDVIAFAALIGFVELAWLAVLFELVRRYL